MIPDAGKGKFYAFVLMVLLSTALLLYSAIDPNIWRDVSIAAMVNFTAGVVTSKRIEHKYGRNRDVED